MTAGDRPSARRGADGDAHGPSSSGPLGLRLVLQSVPTALRKLDPRVMYRSPVMFVVEVGAVLTTVSAVRSSTVFAWVIALWLWLTAVFANLAEAVAEGRGRAQAETLRRARTETTARRLAEGPVEGHHAAEERVAASRLRQGDHVVVEAGEVIPGDGDVVEGIASVDESAITGESAPVVRESGGDRCAVTGGTVPAPSEVQGLAAVMNLLAKIDVDTLLGLSRAPEDRDDRMHVGYSEAATRLNIPEKWLRERIGSLPHRKFGKFVQFAEEDLRAISEMHRVVPNSDGRTKDEPSTETLRPSKRSRRNS